MKNVAIIMRSKNEQPYPRPALEALFAQTEQDFCLYNVDSGSTDGTLEVVREFNPDRVVEIPAKAYIPGKVLNDAIARTREPIVVFLNADAIPLHPEWLERLLRPVREGRADGTMSVQYARPSAIWIVKYDYERAYAPRNIKAENEDFFSAVACAKELARDFLHAVATFKWGTIPYNVVYRITIHVALHRGLAEGAAKRKAGGG